MSRRLQLRFALGLVLAGCGGRPEPMTGTDADSSAEACAGAVFEYRDVCFHAHTVAPVGDRYPAVDPLDLDGEPGDEIVHVDDDRVSVYRFDGEEGFVLVGVADAPPDVSLSSSAVVGEFDEVPGLDLIISEAGEYAALYHLDEAGAPTQVGVTAFGGGSSNDTFADPVAVGPDASGRWRMVAHHDDVGEISGQDPLALWEVQGTTLVQVERLDLPSESCNLSACDDGDLDGDGRTDVVCTLSESCTNITSETDDQIVLLAQADGTVSAAVYPEKWVQHFDATDLDGDGITDLVGERWYRLGDGEGGLGPATRIELPPAPEVAWNVIAAGDLDGDGNVEVVIGDHTHALVFDDIVGAPKTYETFVLSDASLEFRSWPTAAVDVDGDEIVDLWMSDLTVLVSELRQ